MIHLVYFSKKSEIQQNDLLFAGQWGVRSPPYLDGVYSMRHRIYFARYGRFGAIDPYEFGGGYTNLYCYVGNNPVKGKKIYFLLNNGFVIDLVNTKFPQCMAWYLCKRFIFIAYVKHDDSLNNARYTTRMLHEKCHIDIMVKTLLQIVPHCHSHSRTHDSYKFYLFFFAK